MIEAYNCLDCMAEHSNEECPKSIVRWQIATFGASTVEASVRRFNEEVHELLEAVTDDKDDIGGEVADVFITLCRVAYELGVDLEQAVDSKMVINRHRKWTVNPDGTGQHK